MMKFLLFKIRANDLALVLLTDRGRDKLQSRIRTGESTPIILPAGGPFSRNHWNAAGFSALNGVSGPTGMYS
jgi:hypothetical protein